MTTKTVLRCKRVGVRGLGLIGLAALVVGHAGPAAAEPKVVREVQVSERDGKTMIDVQLSAPFRYLMHAPASAGKVIRIRLQPESPASRRAQGRQVVEWRHPDVVPLVNVEYGDRAAGGSSLTATDGPVLTLRFERPVAFEVSQGQSRDRVRVTLLPKLAQKRGHRLVAQTSHESEKPVTQKPAARSTPRATSQAAKPAAQEPKKRRSTAPVDEGYARRGIYISFLPSRSFEAFHDEIEDLVPGIDVSVDDSWALSGRVGYRINPRMAVEVQGEWYEEYNIDLLGVEAAEFQGWSAALMGRVYLLTGRFQPYALAGGGYLDVKLSDKLGLGLSENSSGSMARWGGGIDFDATNRFVISMEGSYVLPLGGLEDLDFWTLGLGLKYRF